MARYKEYSYDQIKLILISFERQILPGTFEYTLNYLIDHEVDLLVFESRYRNDEVGAPAYDPAILLKITLYAYTRGVVSSREEALPRERGDDGALGRQPTAFHHDCQSHLFDERGGHGAVSRRVALLR
jgi:hypothetical protein